MSSRSMRLALLMSAFALMPAASRAQSVADVTAPGQIATPAPSNSALDVPIEEIASSSNGCAILDKDFPGLRTQSMYGFFKALSLNQVAAMSSGRITPDMLAQAQTDLSAVPLTPVASNVPQQTDAQNLKTIPAGNRTSLSASH